jgi:DNA-binding LacI/PurR family transcriptional regulator
MAPTRRITQRDVAAAARVSTATVSYVLSGRRDRARPVSDETRDRVLTAVNRTGYRINHSARSLRRQRTDVACVVYPTPSNPWVEETVDLFVPAAARCGLTTVCLPIVDGAVHDALQFLSGGLADAALLLRGHGLTPGQLHALAAHLAIVAFDDHAKPRGFDVVRTHRWPAQAMVVDRLAGAGRNRLAFFLHYPGELTETGYRAGLQRNGLAERADWIRYVASNRTAAHEAALELLRGRPRPDAIVTASDRSAVQAIYAAQELGLRVPEDVAVIGSGDIDEGRAARPALTTIGPRIADRMAAADRLFERLAGPGRLPGRQLDLPWLLTARDSG